MVVKKREEKIIKKKINKRGKDGAPIQVEIYWSGKSGSPWRAKGKKKKKVKEGESRRLECLGSLLYERAVNKKKKKAVRRGGKLAGGWELKL
jgi:hypothetical protein